MELKCDKFECEGAACPFTLFVNAPHLMHHLKHQIATRITYQQMIDNPNLLPRRSDFLDPDLRAKFKEHIEKKMPIIFLPNSIVEKDEWDKAKQRFVYKIYIFGIIPDGSKTAVILDDVPVYVDIKVPSGQLATEFGDILTGMMVNKKLAFRLIEDIKLRDLMGFQKTKSPYKRIFFNTLDDRQKVIDTINAQNKQFEADKKPRWVTASDDCKRDLSYYFPKVAREQCFRTCDWNRITNYTLDTDGKTQNCEYAIRVNINDFKKLSRDDRKKYAEAKHFLTKFRLLDKNKTMTMKWDIETYSFIQNGEAPKSSDPIEGWKLFMMCATYHWFYSTETLLDVCIVETATNAKKGIGLVIECGTELNVLLAHMDVMNRMNPDITSAFNGANFDWPLYRAKCAHYKLMIRLKEKLSSIPLQGGKYADTEDKVIKKCFKSEKVKIDAETSATLECVACFPGMIDTDTMIVFQRLYPKAEVGKGYSLNFYLAKNKLEGKDDMPYKRMFKIYERSLKLKDIHACHCIQGVRSANCEVCREPWINGITEINENGYVINEENYEYIIDPEGGRVPRVHKCCYCEKKSQSAEDMAEVGHYCKVDAFRIQQLDVKRTVVNDKRELSTMSYVSLYDSFYRADGMKVRNLIGSYCYRYGIAFSNKQPENKSRCWYPGAWVFPPKRGLRIDRPITGLDFSSLYPSLMMAYNFSPDMIIKSREEAERLAAEGYSIYHIPRFPFKRLGDDCKKDCKCHPIEYIEGWTVRHNGVFHRSKDQRIDHYEKLVELKYTTEEGPRVEKFNCGDPRYGKEQFGEAFEAEKNPRADEAQRYVDLFADLKSRGIKVARKVSFNEIRGGEPLEGERMGIFSYIVKKLFDKRVPLKARYVLLSKVKEEMEARMADNNNVLNEAEFNMEYDGIVYNYDDVGFEHSTIDSKQKALKVLTNTYYGESGNSKSPIFEILVAAGITTAGQASIKKVNQFETARGFETDYGDSVTPDTPILVRYGNSMQYRTIESLAIQWQPYHGGKEAAECDYEVWTDLGWTKINRVIRHKTDKQLYRVLTNTGCVDVTEDHSLLNPAGDRITPKDLAIGCDLLHADLPHGLRGSTGNLGRSTRICVEGKLFAATIYHRLCSLGYSVELDTIAADKYILIASRCIAVCRPDYVKKIISLGQSDDYVYDLETTNHHFAAGVGRMVVHNTDSLYQKCPKEKFAKCDEKYYAIRDRLAAKFAAGEVDSAEFTRAKIQNLIEYWTEMVEITMDVMSEEKDEVAEFLLLDNGTRFLAMAYEEVLFPTYLAGKKKYWGIAHIEKVNFYPKELFIRGIDVVKQGQARLTKDLGIEYMREIVSPENELTPMQLAHEKFKKFYQNEWDITNFILSAKFKASKRNVPVHTFVRRMRALRENYVAKGDYRMAALYWVPENGDRFQYVVVKKEQRYTLQGSKVKIQKGDKMEHIAVYQDSLKSADPMQIDLDYYMESFIEGLFARFIAFGAEFQPPAMNGWDPSDPDDYKKIDEYCVKSAAKYINEFCQRMQGINRRQAADVGRAFRSIYRLTDSSLRSDFVGRYGSSSFMIYGLNMHDEPEESAANDTKRQQSRNTQMVNQLKDYAKSLSVDEFYGYKYLEAMRKSANPVSIYRLYTIFTAERDYGIHRHRIILCERKEKQIIDALFKLIPQLSRIIYTYENSVERLIEELRHRRKDVDMIAPTETDINHVNDLKADDQGYLRQIYNLFLQLVAVYKIRNQTDDIVKAIILEKNKLMGAPAPIGFNPRIEAYKDSQEGMVIPDFAFP